MKKFVFVFLLAGMCLPGLWAQDTGAHHESTSVKENNQQADICRGHRLEGSEVSAPTIGLGEVESHVAAGIQPGMRYKHYKALYDPKTYDRQPGDRYIPAVSSVCSVLIPGLGQMICGEVGRGFAYLGGAAGSLLVGTYGGIAMVFVYPPMADFVLLAGFLGYLALDVCAAVDAVRVAKVKNMYEQDLRRQQLSSTLDVRLQPYVSSLSTAMVRTPVAGVSLAVSF